MPVKLPPGRAKLWITPASTGLPLKANTTGIEGLARSRRLQVVAIDGPMKCRRPIHLGSIHIGLPLEQQAKGCLLPFHRRIRDVTGAGTDDEGGGTEQQHRDAAGDLAFLHHAWPDSSQLTVDNL